MRVWCLSALVMTVGCSFDSAATVVTIDNSCAGDAGCSQGVCAGSICIDDSGASVALAIEVVRGPAEAQVVTPASWAFAAESTSTSRDLQLPATRQVVGTVRWNGAPVPATLRFVRRMDEVLAPLVPIAIEVDTFREPSTADGSEGNDFSTVLVAGETYDLGVLPSSDMVMVPAQEPAPAVRSLPPLYFAFPIAEGDPSEPFRIDISYPAGLADDCTVDRDIGCTFRAEIYSRDNVDQIDLPEAGLQVRAIDKQTGRVVSSIAETDADGRFEIRVSNDASDYLIRITSSAGRAPFPAVSVDPDLLFVDNPVEKIIYIPRLAPVQASGSVRDKIGRAVPGATVRFLSTKIFGGAQLGLEGSFSGSATTDEDGSFGAELLTGFYAITVTPPEDIANNWGIQYDAAAVGEEGVEIGALVVPAQIGFSGTVSTFRDELAPGVTVLARARPAVDSGSVHRSQEVVSDDLGDFAMSVDIGVYDMQVKLPAESGFAWLVEPEVQMSLNEGDLRRDYRLEPPVAVGGIIRNGQGETVPNALVRGYVLDPRSVGTRPLQVAEAVSGEDGSYRLLIAPRLVGE
ncbi:MAG: carboxypeptidase-like regulatory domain-containing protein [Deltaproteobacteria bacterium]|nr:carboxypeptidase-like regulatory domain-containing protein [Deltaproteobacteria bacterium]